LRDARDLDHRLSSPLGLAGLEPDGEPVGHVGLDPRVVVLRRDHRHRVQPPRIQGPPDAVDTLDLVRHGDVGMQVGTSGTGVVVRERDRDQARGFDLRDAVGAGAGMRGVGLQKAKVSVVVCSWASRIASRTPARGSSAHSSARHLTG
jgi:hypothetical protein